MAVDQDKFEQTLKKILDVRVDYGSFGPELSDRLFQVILWSIRFGPDKLMQDDSDLSNIVPPDDPILSQLSNAQIQKLRDEHRAYVVRRQEEWEEKERQRARDDVEAEALNRLQGYGGGRSGHSGGATSSHLTAKPVYVVSQGTHPGARPVYEVAQGPIRMRSLCMR